MRISIYDVTGTSLGNFPKLIKRKKCQVWIVKRNIFTMDRYLCARHMSCWRSVSNSGSAAWVKRALVGVHEPTVSRSSCGLRERLSMPRAASPRKKNLWVRARVVTYWWFYPRWAFGLNRLGISVSRTLGFKVREESVLSHARSVIKSQP